MQGQPQKGTDALVVKKKYFVPARILTILRSTSLQPCNCTDFARQYRRVNRHGALQSSVLSLALYTL